MVDRSLKLDIRSKTIYIKKKIKKKEVCVKVVVCFGPGCDNFATGVLRQPGFEPGMSRPQREVLTTILLTLA